MNASEKQFSFTRAALSTGGRARNQIPFSLRHTCTREAHPSSQESLIGSGGRSMRRSGFALRKPTSFMCYNPDRVL